MQSVSRVRYSFQSDSQASGVLKRLLKCASRHVNSIMICVILLLAACVFVTNSLQLDRVFSALSKLRHIEPSSPASKIFHYIPTSNSSFLDSLKAPSISLSFPELMEHTNDGWLNYYRSHELQLSRMTPTQIMCAYQCWSDRKCLGFIYREALRRMCNLIRSTHSRCCNASSFTANSSVSLDSVNSYLYADQSCNIRVTRSRFWY